MLSVRRIPPPPPQKKNNLPTTRKNRTIAISEENVISFRITRSLLIHPYTLSKQSQPSKRNFNPSQKNFNPPPPKYLYSSGTISTTRKKSCPLFKNTNSSPKILPPPLKKCQSARKFLTYPKISQPLQNVFCLF